MMNAEQTARQGHERRIDKNEMHREIRRAMAKCLDLVLHPSTVAELLEALETRDALKAQGALPPPRETKRILVDYAIYAGTVRKEWLAQRIASCPPYVCMQIDVREIAEMLGAMEEVDGVRLVDVG